MKRNAAIFIVLTLFSMLTPIVAGNMPSNMFELGYRIKGTGIDVPEGYWVYGKFENTFMTESMRDIVVEVTLLDATGTELDVVTARVNQTIVSLGGEGSFLAKSSTLEEVAEIKYKLESHESTDDVSFKYLEMSTIWTVENGVTGWLENVHDTFYVTDAEVIATFLDADGYVVDIQSYMMNYGGKFDVGEKKKWFCETEKEFDSYFLTPQCNLQSRNRYLRLHIDRPNNVNNTWTPPIGETIILILEDTPHFARDYVDVVITDPLGNSTNPRFIRSGLEDYRFEITPDIPGVWNVTWVTQPFWVKSGTWAEGTQLDAGFFTWDPNPVEDNSASTDIEEIPTTNTTTPDIELPVEVDSIIKDTTSSASKIIDSATSTAEGLVDSLPDEVKNKIPGFPVSSIYAAFAVVFFLFLRKN